MTSKSLTLEYQELLKKGYIIKEVKERICNNKYHLAQLSLSNKFIGQKIKISLYSRND